MRTVSAGCARSLLAELLPAVPVQIVLNPRPHESRRCYRAVLPGKHRVGENPVEAYLGERAEESIPVHLAFADIQVLMHANLGARRVDDVAQPSPMVERIGYMDVSEYGGGVTQHARKIRSHIEGVRRAKQITEVGRVEPAD